MLSVAVGWQVYALTGSALYLGLVGLAQFLPMFILTLVVGMVADRFDRRLIARICQLIQGGGAMVLALGSRGGWLSAGSILAIVFLIGAARAFERPSMQSLLPALVPKELFPKAAAWSAAATETAFIVGPAAGGFLYLAGPTVVYSAAGGMALMAALSLSILLVNWEGEPALRFPLPTLAPKVRARSSPSRTGHEPRAATKGATPPWNPLEPLPATSHGARSLLVERKLPKREPVVFRSIFAGISFIRRRPIILGAISLDLFAVLLGGATALLPIYAKNILRIGSGGLGILRAAPSIGALLVSAYLTRKPPRRAVGRRMFSAVMVFGAGTIVFAVSRSFALSLAALIILGGADIISVVIRQSLVQMGTPDRMRGRVSAVNSLFVGTSNQLGEFESGITAAWFGVVPAVLIGGIGTIVVALLWMRVFPQLAAADTLEAMTIET
jgi:MFS family permease